MIEAVLDALTEVLRNAVDNLAPEIALDNIAAERQRQSGSFQPPFSKIKHLMHALFTILQLAFVDEESGFVLSLLNFLEDLVEGHDFVLHVGFIEPEGEKRAGQRARD